MAEESTRMIRVLRFLHLFFSLHAIATSQAFRRHSNRTAQPAGDRDNDHLDLVESPVPSFPWPDTCAKRPSSSQNPNCPLLSLDHQSISGEDILLPYPHRSPVSAS